MDINREIFLMQQAYATLFSLANKLQVQGDHYLDKLTSRQYMAMVAIAHLPEHGATINNVARKLGTTKQSVKQMISIIEGKGYIKTLPSLKDKRAVNLRITESGRQVLMECSEKGLYFLADFFCGISTEEIETLWDLLKRLYCFDGEKQDGFEEDPEMELSGEQSKIRTRALTEFERRRNRSKREGGEAQNEEK